MNNTAFDLDGVFVPDCDLIPDLGGLGEFYQLCYYMRPLFQPQGNWSIITGRPARYRAATLAWVNQHFANRPERVWHELVDQTPEEYKRDVINQNQIAAYVESDLKIVNYLKQHTQAEIIHFDQWVAQQFR